MKKINKPKLIFDRVTPSLLEVMPYEYRGKKIEINIESEEFTCLCPWSGLPDFAYLNISYVPDKVVVELKSLKYYLQSFRPEKTLDPTFGTKTAYNDDEMLAMLANLRGIAEVGVR